MKKMREGEKYVFDAYRNGLITAAQASALKRHARHHSRAHMCMMLRLIIGSSSGERLDLSTAHTVCTRLVGK